jgi:hypothetical protein
MVGRESDLCSNAATEMISDRDIWAGALLMVQRYGGDAMLVQGAELPQRNAS